MIKHTALNAAADELQAAIKDRDGKAATTALDRIRDLDANVADQVLDSLIAAGLKRASQK